MFAEKYVSSINSSDLRDDELHHSTDALIAAANADSTGSGAVLGSLLCRVKYADGTVHKLFEAGTGNLAALLRIWTAVVTEKGKARGWIKARNTWDLDSAYVLYKRVAHASLAHWLDGRCAPCAGSGVVSKRTCTCCAGSGRAQIEAGRFETDKILDMVSELEGLYLTHGTRATARLRRGAR